MTKTLTAFFSRADENYFGGAMRYVKVGNTEIVCDIIKDLTGADSFKIEMKDPYPCIYDMYRRSEEGPQGRQASGARLVSGKS